MFVPIQRYCTPYTYFKNIPIIVIKLDIFLVNYLYKLNLINYYV